MTNKEAISMIEAKLECLKRSTSGSDIMCNARDCDNCELNYAQGNIGEQKEWLKLAITALHNQEQKTGHWIEEDVFDGDVAYRCSECDELFWLESGTPKDNEYNFCPKCGASMEDEE